MSVVLYCGLLENLELRENIKDFNNIFESRKIFWYRGGDIMNYPIVFVPGLYGSLGDDIIYGTGEFSFGFAEKIYRPFIEILKEMGYVEGLNLFISYYNWKLRVLDAVDRYLLPDIEYIKKKTGYDKVVIIGHSLGGLLGRAYISYFSPSSVDKLIMIGTPNLGAVNSYYFWSGGQIPYFSSSGNRTYEELKDRFIGHYKIGEKINYVEILRKIFPVVEDLLPSYEYGDYLFYDVNGIKIELPIEDMSIKNNFLNGLEDKTIDSNNLFIIAGSGIETNDHILVDREYKSRVRWKDGKPIEVYKTVFGDGTVTRMSALGNLRGNYMVLKGNHTDILYNSKDYLRFILY